MEFTELVRRAAEYGKSLRIGAARASAVRLDDGSGVIVFVSRGLAPDEAAFELGQAGPTLEVIFMGGAQKWGEKKRP